MSLGGQLLPGKDLDKVASLPTREQALSMLMGVMKAPIQKLVGTLAAPPTQAGAHARRRARPEAGRRRRLIQFV